MSKIIGNTVGTTINPKKIGEYLDPAKSAYDIARGNGFEGTEKEWLDTLKGDPVTVESVQQSPDDGGENIVTFSDGSQMSVWNGNKGKDGTSVTVVSKNESKEDGGFNTITFGTGGLLHRFTVRNGSTGKTAYEYASDAGYTGTEEEFSEKMAADNVTEVADEVSSGNMLPVTSNAVAQTVGNIEILLSTI